MVYAASACNGFKNDGVMIAAASNELWGNGVACGNKYKVKCLSGTNARVPHPYKVQFTICGYGCSSWKVTAKICVKITITSLLRVKISWMSLLSSLADKS